MVQPHLHQKQHHVPVAPPPSAPVSQQQQQQAYPSNQYTKQTEITQDDTLYQDPPAYYSNHPPTSRWQGKTKKEIFKNYHVIDI
jgi:hypothetical protein